MRPDVGSGRGSVIAGWSEGTKPYMYVQRTPDRAAMSYVNVVENLRGLRRKVLYRYLVYDQTTEWPEQATSHQASRRRRQADCARWKGMLLRVTDVNNETRGTK